MKKLYVLMTALLALFAIDANLPHGLSMEVRDLSFQQMQVTFFSTL